MARLGAKDRAALGTASLEEAMARNGFDCDVIEDGGEIRVRS
jgi:hypothetical protein